MSIESPLLRGALVAWLTLGTSSVALKSQTNSTPVAERLTYRSDRILVKPRAFAPMTIPDSWVRARGHRVLRTFPDLDHWQVIQLAPGTAVAAAIESCLQSGNYEFVEPDYRVQAATVPNDPEFVNGRLWALQNTGMVGGTPGADISAPAAWSLIHSASNIVVAVVDSGVRVTHVDLADNIWANPGEIAGNGKDDDHNGIVDDVHGLNAIDDSGNIGDDSGHGTHIAGTIGAVGNNGTGTVGVAWKVQLMICQFLNSEGDGYVSDAVQCLDYARTKGAKIVNASWYVTESSQALRAALESLRSQGVLVIAAAGNGGKDIDASPVYPPAFGLDNVITVAASTRTDALAGFSNYGSNTVQLAAPGTDIYGPWRGGDNLYAYFNGTSMAAPYVSGAAALLRARFPSEGYLQIRKRLLDSVDLKASLSGKCATGGRLNLHRAMGPAANAAFSMSTTNGIAPLEVKFRNLSTGLVSQFVWAFGDGVSVTNEAAPIHVYVHDGLFPVTLTVLAPDDSVYVATNAVTAIAQYLTEPAPFKWQPTNGLTKLSLTGDAVSGSQSLPFPFYLYNRRHESVYIAVNGMLGFISNGLAMTKNLALPNPSAPREVICPYWDDLSPNTTSGIFCGVTGSAPDRRFVASWVQTPIYGYSNVKLSFQVMLEELTQAVVMQYQEVYPGLSQGGGRSATVGLQNDTGLVGLTYTYQGTPHVLTNQLALRYTPTSLNRILVSTGSQDAIAGPQGGPFAPARIQFNLSNLGQVSLSWTAISSVEWLQFLDASGTLNPWENGTVAAQITTNILSLTPGSYQGQVWFLNTSTGLGQMGENVQLVVNPPVPAVLQVAGFIPETQISLRLSGASRQPYVLELSSDCQAWLPHATNTTTMDGIADFVDWLNPGTSTGFYRARKLSD
jgi:subtilisin family serine protease